MHRFYDYKIFQPILRTKSKKIRPIFEYNKAEQEFSILIPEDTSYPLLLTLGAGVKIPSVKVLESHLGTDEFEIEEPKVRIISLVIYLIIVANCRTQRKRARGSN